MLFIFKVLVTNTESHIITCGKDGVVLVWKLPELADNDPGAPVRDRLDDFPKVDEMLVTKSDLEVNYLNF